MNYPKYVRTFDGYIGTFQYLDFGEFPVYRFPGGDRIADDWEIANGRDDRDFPPIIVYSLNQNGISESYRANEDMDIAKALAYSKTLAPFAELREHGSRVEYADAVYMAQQGKAIEMDFDFDSGKVEISFGKEADDSTRIAVGSLDNIPEVFDKLYETFRDIPEVTEPKIIDGEEGMWKTADASTINGDFYRELWSENYGRDKVPHIYIDEAEEVREEHEILFKADKALDLQKKCITFSAVSLDGSDPYFTGRYISSVEDLEEEEWFGEYCDRCDDGANVLAEVTYYTMGASAESERADERQIEYLTEHRRDWDVIETIADAAESRNFYVDIEHGEEDDEDFDCEP